MRRPITEALALGALLACALFPGCSVYDSSLLHTADSGVDVALDTGVDTATDVSLTDGSVDSSADGMPDTSQAETEPGDAPDPLYCDKCKDPTLVRPPCAPQVADSTSLSETLIFAAKTFRMGANPDKTEDWRVLGFDQDCRATQSNGEPLGCKRPQEAQAYMMEDGDQGRDNSFAKNFGANIAKLAKENLINIKPEDEGNRRFGLGYNTVLFAISSYNGTPNDPSITLTFYLGGNTQNTKTGNYQPANWDGNDVWVIDAESVTYGSNLPLYVDDSAYVTNGTLVARLPNGLLMKILGAYSTLMIQLNEPRIVGKLSQDLTQFSDVVLSGVWQTENALASLISFAREHGICPGTLQYDLATKIVPLSADMRLDLTPAPEKECNALSMAVGFDAYRANLGQVRAPLKPNPIGCDGGK